MKRPCVKIIGIGNPLMGDDGAGIAAVERLFDVALPDGVAAIDGGTGGLSLLYLMEDADRVIFIDTVAMNAPAGTVRRFDGAALAAGDEWPAALSLHETGLVEVLMIARQVMRVLPEIILYGIEPQSLEHRIGLSPAVEEGVTRAIRKLGDDIAP